MDKNIFKDSHARALWGAFEMTGNPYAYMVYSEYKEELKKSKDEGISR